MMERGEDLQHAYDIFVKLRIQSGNQRCSRVLEVFCRVRVRSPNRQNERAHPARGPEWDMKILRQCMRRKPHASHGLPLPEDKVAVQ